MFLRFVVAVSLLLSSTAAGQAVRPAPYRPPPAYTPGYAPGTPAEPVYAPVGAGAPGERVPGAVAPGVPRSEGRMLPRTSEPGVWAADGDPKLVASRRGIYGWDVLGVMLPAPDTTSKDKLHWSQTCAGWLRGAVSAEPGVRQSVEALSGSERTCLLAALYHWCLETRKAALPKEAEDLIEYRHLLDTLWLSEKFRADSCNKTTVTRRVLDLSPRIQAHWKKNPL